MFCGHLLKDSFLKKIIIMVCPVHEMSSLVFCLIKWRKKTLPLQQLSVVGSVAGILFLDFFSLFLFSNSFF